MAGTATLICPKCRGEMSTYERNGVQVDQCEECRGIFLDRGELEKLIEAATSSMGEANPRDGEQEHAHDHDHDHDHDHGAHRRRRGGATSLLSEFLGGGE